MWIVWSRESDAVVDAAAPPDPDRTSGLMPTTTDYAGSQTLMFTGQSGFYLQGEWEITTAQSIQGLEFGMVPVPTMYDKPADMPAPPHWLLYTRVHDVNDAVARVQKNGGQVLNGPMEVPGGDVVAACMDPQGAAFALHEKRS